MADFKTHTLIGTGAGIGLSCFAVMENFISLSGSALTVFLAAFASALPDIDSDTGCPRQFALSALEILCPTIFIISFADELSLENLLLIGMVVFFLIRYLFGFLTTKLTKHRGAWHSIPMALISAMIIFLLFYSSELSSRIVFSLTFFICFLFHLILDEIFSLKYFGLATKRSFGTALKFTGSTRGQTVLMYLIIIVLAGICFFEQMIGAM